MKFARGRKLDNSPDIISPSACINLCTQEPSTGLARHPIMVRENEDNGLANTAAGANTEIQIQETNTDTNGINTNTGTNTEMISNQIQTHKCISHCTLNEV